MATIADTGHVAAGDQQRRQPLGPAEDAQPATDLNYAEEELRASPELFVWISANNGVLENFRNISLPACAEGAEKHSVLANVVVVVRADSTTYL